MSQVNLYRSVQVDRSVQVRSLAVNRFRYALGERRFFFLKSALGKRAPEHRHGLEGQWPA
jgi:hypothetical protein